MVNISDYALTAAQTRLLSKGLSFCPSEHLNWVQLELNLTQFFRKLKLKIWFSNAPVTSAPLETFMELVRKDIDQLKDVSFGNFFPT